MESHDTLRWPFGVSTLRSVQRPNNYRAKSYPPVAKFEIQGIKIGFLYIKKRLPCLEAFAEQGIKILLQAQAS